MRLDPDRLEAICGNRETARRLMEQAAGCRIPRWTDRRVSRETLFADIRASLRAGATYAEAAAAHGVSRYTVWRAVVTGIPHKPVDS